MRLPTLLPLLPFLVFVCLLSAALTPLFPARAEATENDSIYVRVHISPEAYEAWRKSPMKHMHDFQDWREMTDQWSPDWVEYYYKWDFPTMGDLVRATEREAADWQPDATAMQSRPYIHYDPQEGVFTYAQLFYDENFINYMLDISAYRMFADFKDTDTRDFLVVYPYFWDPGYTVILEIGRGYTKFHTEQTAPAAFQEFIETANAHFDAEIDALPED